MPTGAVITVSLMKYEDFIVDELRSCPSYSIKQIEDHLEERYGESLKEVCSKTIFNYVVHLRAKHCIPRKFDKPPRPYEKFAYYTTDPFLSCEVLL